MTNPVRPVCLTGWRISSASRPAALTRAAASLTCRPRASFCAAPLTGPARKGANRISGRGSIRPQHTSTPFSEALPPWKARAAGTGTSPNTCASWTASTTEATTTGWRTFSPSSTLPCRKPAARAGTESTAPVSSRRPTGSRSFSAVSDRRPEAGRSPEKEPRNRKKRNPCRNPPRRPGKAQMPAERTPGKRSFLPTCRK